MGWIESSTRVTCLAAFFASGLALPAVAASHLNNDELKSVLRGQTLAQDRCATCHEVGSEGTSTHPEAVPFRYIARLYPVENLEEAFAEGIYVGHPDMPTFELSVDDLTDLLNYLKAVQED
ncbi:cytochrome c [Pararhizobium sp. IMCC21322]|uniref:c-type cytochrome n=1 Tax=Pararhizobium sp. IMCC21322 TaxID=3067903 RepID=UPI002741D4D0|nr:c-type cytochrome [Pararhizobium sp. IMCC21322]